MILRSIIHARIYTPIVLVGLPKQRPLLADTGRPAADYVEALLQVVAVRRTRLLVSDWLVQQCTLLRNTVATNSAHFSGLRLSVN